jgi:hypothetical protein
MTISIKELHDAFILDRRHAERAHLGELVTVEAYALSTGSSQYSTPIVMASDTPEGDALAVFVLPFDDRIDASFARLRSVEPGQRLRVTGECRRFDDGDAVIVFKDCELVEI